MILERSVASFFEVQQTSMMSTKDLDKIDSKTKHLVHGFVREMNSILTQIIPEPIIYVILSFYFLGEYFEIFDPKYYKVTEENKTVTKTSNTGWSVPSCYGKMLIDSDSGGVYEWVFRILTQNTCMDYGISSSYNLDKAFTRSSESSNYCARYAAHKVSKNKQEYWSGFHMSPGNCLKMKLDLNKRTLSYDVDADPIGVAWENIDVGPDIKYRMAIFFLHSRCSIKLLSCEVSP